MWETTLFWLHAFLLLLYFVSVLASFPLPSAYGPGHGEELIILVQLTLSLWMTSFWGFFRTTLVLDIVQSKFIRFYTKFHVKPVVFLQSTCTSLLLRITAKLPASSKNFFKELSTLKVNLCQTRLSHAPESCTFQRYQNVHVNQDMEVLLLWNKKYKELFQRIE